jgi:UDP-N-acetylmuramoylalanine--D-glutamate ligase|tara:strand:+ start:4164 stop:5480 length:1317 start_codon:yes stop_codon:yes gene_type:complete
MLELANQFNNQNILIYGFGKSGRACFKYLRKNNKIEIYDDKKSSIPKNLKKNSINKTKLTSVNFDRIVVSPGIDINKCTLKKYLSKNKSKIISELDIFYLNNIKNKKITITGTNGKSTTSKLLHDVLKKHGKDVRLVGNIGNPLLLEKNIKPKTIFVIEASSYQIEYSKYFKTDFAIILNISPNHLERHRTFKNYIKSKFGLIKSQKKNSFAFIEKNNNFLKEELKKNKINSKIIKVNLKISNKIKKKIKNSYFENKNNLNNLKFVLEISKKLKLKNQKVFKVVNSFKELNFRQQILYKNKKLLIINDSKSTNFSSSINLLESYKNIYWLVGGRFKKGDNFVLNKKYYKNINAYIFGKRKKFFVKNLINKIKYKTFDNIKNALVEIIIDAKKKNLSPVNIIFSPSAASFDQFSNFEERGKNFNYLVRKLKIISKINGR